MLLDGDRTGATRLLGARPSDDWPASTLSPVLRGQATMPTALLRYGIWTIAELASEMIVGDIGFHGPPDDAGLVEIGFSVIPSRRRQGIVSEAATAIVTATIARPEITGIVARCDLDNAASIATLRRVGFVERSRTGGMIHWTL